MSQTKAEKSETGDFVAHRLLEILTRLKEVRRRYAFETDNGEKFTQTGKRLDSIISDMDEWLKPGGSPVELGDLDLQLATVEQMIEATGFPGYARVIASVRETLQLPAADSTPEEEPPEPKRYQPRPQRHSEQTSASIITQAAREAGVDEWELKAELERKSDRQGRLLWFIVIAGCITASAALWHFWLDSAGTEPTSRTEPIIVEAPVVVQPTAAPVLNPTPIPSMMMEAVKLYDDKMAIVAREISLAQEALGNEDPDLALQHLVAAVAIDRHHRRVSDTAGTLIDVLLQAADEAFDDTEWELADHRINQAFQIAHGLHLDPSAIENTAERHALMTRFQDITPENRGAFRRAVGHAVRVTLTNWKVITGRLVAFENDTLLLEVHSGVEGGGVQFSKEIPLATVLELRVFETELPSETIVSGAPTE